MKRFAVLMLSLFLVGMLAGCDSADYKEAVSLYENGDYEEAMAMFEALGDYEDSQNLLAQCCYDYAVALFDDDAYADARVQFLQLEQTEDVEAYLRLCAWGMVRDYLDQEGPVEMQDSQYDVEENAKVESVCQIMKQGKRVEVNVRSVEVENLGLGILYTTTTDVVVSFDGKQTQPELSAEAEHTMKSSRSATTFHNVGTCLWDMASYVADEPVVWEEYIHIEKDGTMDDTRHAPAFDSRVTMLRTLIATSLEQILEDAGLGLTMADLGFTSYN